MSRLLIIDGHAIVHRAYHSMPKNLTSNGRVVNAVYGFYSMLLSAVDLLSPDYVIVCSDSPGPNFRNEEFIGYRSKRVVPDRDLISQFPILSESLEVSTIPTFAIGGFEADDIIATIARRSLKKQTKKSKRKLVDKVTIITGDKDLMQLVDDQTELFMPIRGLSETKLITPPQVEDKLGIRPDQVVDLKALMGDQSDSYPGVQGIGPKGAVDLLSKYQTLDNLYSHLSDPSHSSDLSDSLKQKLLTGRDDAYLSQKLATLVYNVPLEFSLKSAKWGPQKQQALIEVFKSFNFKSLIGRLKQGKSALQTELKKGKSALQTDPNQGSLF